MKKWFLGLLLVIILFAAAVYVFIPNTISISHTISLEATQPGLYRAIAGNDDWTSWWPGVVDSTKKNKNTFNYLYKGNSYSVTHKTVSALDILLTSKKLASTTNLVFLPGESDSVTLRWGASIVTSYNPFKRLSLFLASKDLATDINEILKKIQSHFSAVKNVYGIEIKKDHVADSALIFTSETTNGYPSTEFVYGLIARLKKYTAAQSARETGYPMLNISTKDSITFLTKVAIPVNKKLPDAGNISYRWMLRGGNILTADVKGGPLAINSALSQIENYISDYHRVAPAISFLSLITDRSMEPDTAKWVTRIFYPVM